MAACSFCWLDKSKVGALAGVAAENLFICDQCVTLIAEMIAAQKPVETESPTNN